MKIDFRGNAATYTDEARQKLAANTENNLRSAALFLRLAMEALTYERASLFSDDLSPSDVKTWQPRKLMQRLIDIDPHADQSSGLSIGIEPSPGETPETMSFLGTEQVLNLATIRKHYDALGSYLHMETLSKAENGHSHDWNKLRKKCNAIADAVEQTLASPVWKVDFKATTEINCFECDSLIRRRFRVGQEKTIVACFTDNCPAEYEISETVDGKVHWEPLYVEIKCHNKTCKGTFPLWREETKSQGKNWHCKTCNAHHTIALGISLKLDNSESSKQV